jgi:hypothetical protein
MPAYTIRMSEKQGQLGAEFIVSRPSEHEAIEGATSLFSERYPERRLTDYELRTTTD